MAPNPRGLVSLQEEAIRTQMTHSAKDAHVRTAVYKTRREASEETNPADGLISDCWPPEL